MASTVRVTARKGQITLDELEDFVRIARDAGVRGDEWISGETTGKGELVELEAEVP